MFMKNTTTILAGNPLVDIRDGELYIESQIAAFEDAMQYIQANRADINRVYIGFDHLGIFGDRFVNPILSLSGHQRNSPRVSMLLPEITEAYKPIAEKYGVNLAEIRIITEAQCRMTMLQFAHENIVAHDPMYNFSNTQCGDTGGCKIDSDIDSNEPNPEKLRVTCKGIFAEFMRRCAKGGSDVLGFFEYDQRRLTLDTALSGVQLAKTRLGVESNIKCIIKAPHREMVIENGNLILS